MNLLNKNVLVCGVAKSGISTSFLLKKKGANVILQDLKNRHELDFDLEEIEAENIKLYLGKNPDDIALNQDLIVLSPGIPSDLPFILNSKNSGIKVISEIELAYNFCKGEILAITGTNGKTTTTVLLGQIVKKYNDNTEVVGNIGIPFTEKVLNVKDNGFVVAELSSFQLENIENFRPKVASILNITPDHLNRHKTMENYILAKQRIFENQLEDDFLILNYEDNYCKDMKNSTKSNVIFFSSKQYLDRGSYCDNKSIYVNFNGVNEKIIDIDELNILGKHNLENIMCAILSAICINIPLSIIRNVLRDFKAVEHRIEFVRNFNGIDFYNDSKGTNPDATIKAIYSMVKPITLIGGGYDKNSDFTEFVLSFFGKVKHFVIIGDVKHRLKDICDKLYFTQYTICDTLEDAVKKGYELSKEGDCILFSPACASFDMFKNYEERGNIFKEIVNLIGG